MKKEDLLHDDYLISFYADLYKENYFDSPHLNLTVG